MGWSGLPEDIEDRIIPEPNSGCWIWLGALYDTTEGYGGCSHEGKSDRSHRLVFRLLVGPIPKGLALDHRCRNRLCCNPEHLEPVTWKTNIHRGNGIAAHNMKKTHCKRGHPYEGGNLYVWNNQRFCVICSNAHKKRNAEKTKQLADPAFQYDWAMMNL